MGLVLRINGIAPAWPVLLEYPHAFYSPDDAMVLGSTSYSLLSCSDEEDKPGGWEILIDAGHNTVPFLLNNGNRIPDAIVLTHGHPDHILGVDWIVQSHRYKHRNLKTKIPVYCPKGVWDMLIRAYSHIEPYCEHKELLPGQSKTIDEADGLSVTAFPVFHGKNAHGASMLYFESKTHDAVPLILTGDMLCPLLRKKDWERISNTGVLCIDTNNRFPFPKSNHISFAGHDSKEKVQHEIFREWFAGIKLADLITPHKTGNQFATLYFDEFLSDWNHTSEMPHTILGFLQRVSIPDVFLVHYWGIYDEIYYGEKVLNASELEAWANKLAGEEGLGHCSIHVPKPGDRIELTKPPGSKPY